MVLFTNQEVCSLTGLEVFCTLWEVFCLWDPLFCCIAPLRRRPTCRSGKRAGSVSIPRWGSSTSTTRQGELVFDFFNVGIWMLLVFFFVVFRVAMTVVAVSGSSRCLLQVCKQAQVVVTWHICMTQTQSSVSISL